VQRVDEEDVPLAPLTTLRVGPIAFVGV